MSLPEIMFSRDIIDVTPLLEPDPEWFFQDRAGHQHRWIDGGLPSLRWIIEVEAGEEMPEVGHYECRECGEKIEPLMRVPIFRSFAPGLVHCSIDGRPVAEDEMRDIMEEKG